jgi:hypothetical protein
MWIASRIIVSYSRKMPQSNLTAFQLERKGNKTQSAATCSRRFLAHGFLYPEDGGDTFLRNVGSHKIYIEPHPRRWHSSKRNKLVIIVVMKWKFSYWLLSNILLTVFFILSRNMRYSHNNTLCLWLANIIFFPSLFSAS